MQTTSIVTDKNLENDYGFDVSCNLGSLDIHSATKNDNFEKLIDTSMRLLTQVSDMTNIVNVPSVVNANKNLHSVGLGLMDLHGHLISQNILYGSEESIEFTDYFFEALNYYSLKSSMLIAKERKQSFYGFEESKYANGEYFKEYINKEDKIPSTKVKKALGKVPVITSEMWKELKYNVQKYGVYNAYRNAVAP